jgi:hypothetical protein
MAGIGLSATPNASGNASPVASPTGPFLTAPAAAGAWSGV